MRSDMTTERSRSFRGEDAMLSWGLSSGRTVNPLVCPSGFSSGSPLWPVASCGVVFPSPSPMLPLRVLSPKSWSTSDSESEMEGRASVSPPSPSGGQWKENFSVIGTVADEIRVSTPVALERTLVIVTCSEPLGSQACVVRCRRQTE